MYFVGGGSEGESWDIVVVVDGLSDSEVIVILSLREARSELLTVV